MASHYKSFLFFPPLSPLSFLSPLSPLLTEAVLIYWAITSLQILKSDVLKSYGTSHPRLLNYFLSVIIVCNQQRHQTNFLNLPISSLSSFIPSNSVFSGLYSSKLIFALYSLFIPSLIPFGGSVVTITLL